MAPYGTIWHHVVSHHYICQMLALREQLQRHVAALQEIRDGTSAAEQEARRELAAQATLPIPSPPLPSPAGRTVPQWVNLHDHMWRNRRDIKHAHSTPRICATIPPSSLPEPVAGLTVWE